MKLQKAFVNQEEKAFITCPNCNIKRDICVKKLKNKHKVKIKCTCSLVFAIQLEYRKKFRKETSLDGFYKLMSEIECEKTVVNWESVQINDTDRKANCTIKNLSINGVGCIVTNPPALSLGEKLKFIFNLDNSACTQINKKAIVRVSNGNYIGCEFFEQDKDDLKLKFYAL